MCARAVLASLWHYGKCHTLHTHTIDIPHSHFSFEWLQRGQYKHHTRKQPITSLVVSMFIARRIYELNAVCSLWLVVRNDGCRNGRRRYVAHCMRARGCHCCTNECIAQRIRFMWIVVLIMSMKCMWHARMFICSAFVALFRDGATSTTTIVMIKFGLFLVYVSQRCDIVDSN